MLDVFVYEARDCVRPLGDGVSQAVRPGFPFTLFSLCLYLVSRIVAAHESREPVEFGEGFFPCLRRGGEEGQEGQRGEECSFLHGKCFLYVAAKLVFFSDCQMPERQNVTGGGEFRRISGVRGGWNDSVSGGSRAWLACLCFRIRQELFDGKAVLRKNPQQIRHSLQGIK